MNTDPLYPEFQSRHTTKHMAFDCALCIKEVAQKIKESHGEESEQFKMLEEAYQSSREMVIRHLPEKI